MHIATEDSRNQFNGRAPLTLIDAVLWAAAVDGTKPDDVIEVVATPSSPKNARQTSTLCGDAIRWSARNCGSP